MIDKHLHSGPQRPSTSGVSSLRCLQSRVSGVSSLLHSQQARVASQLPMATTGTGPAWAAGAWRPPKRSSRPRGSGHVTQWVISGEVWSSQVRSGRVRSRHVILSRCSGLHFAFLAARSQEPVTRAEAVIIPHEAVYAITGGVPVTALPSRLSFSYRWQIAPAAQSTCLVATLQVTTPSATGHAQCPPFLKPIGRSAPRIFRFGRRCPSARP